MKKKIGVLGCGNMGSVLVQGLVESRTCPVTSMYVSDIRKEKLKDIRKIGVRVVDNNELAKNSDVIILAVKPAIVGEVVRDIREFLNPSKVLISIAAGVKTSKIEGLIGKKKVPVIRVMPNVNVRVKAGILPYCLGRYASRYCKLPEKLFAPLGIVFRLPEKMFDSVTAITGSGPGFIFYIAENIKKICKEKKFTEKQSALITSYLIYGSGRMLTETGLSPEALKTMVTSPGGTTFAGLKVFEKRKFLLILKEVIKEAEKRSKELSMS